MSDGQSEGVKPLSLPKSLLDDIAKRRKEAEQLESAIDILTEAGIDVSGLKRDTALVKRIADRVLSTYVAQEDGEE